VCHGVNRAMGRENCATNLTLLIVVHCVLTYLLSLGMRMKVDKFAFILNFTGQFILFYVHVYLY